MSIPAFAREEVVVLEIDLDTCALTYATAPCTAAGAAGSECYNTFRSCQDRANYTRARRTHRFISRGAVIPAGEELRPYLLSAKSAPTEIDPDAGLARRANTTVTLADEPDSDTGVDPYLANRAAAPSGTFWTRLLARNRNYAGRPARILRAYLTDGFDWDVFSTEYYIIEKITGPGKDGTVTVTLKDPIKLADRVKLPAPTSGKLAVALTASDLSLTLQAGQGGQYDAAGFVRVKDEVIEYTGKRPYAGFGFNGSADSWSASGATITARASSILVESGGADPQISRTGLAFSGGLYRYVLAKLRRVAGSGWDGQLFYTTGSHGFSASYVKDIAEPAWAEYTNAIKYSQAFENAAWTKSNATVTADAATAPDGTTTADKIEDASGAASGYMEQSVTIATDQRGYVALYVDKDATGRATRFCGLQLYYSGSHFATLHLDTTTGETNLPAVTGSVTVQDYGAEDVGEYWRLWIAGSCAAAVTSLALRFYPAMGASSTWVEGVAATGYVHAWGAQAVRNTTALTPYVATTDLPAGDFVIAVWDMHNLTTGGVDWSQETITGLQIDLGSAASSDFEVGWIGYSPDPASQDDVLYWADGTYRAQYGTGSAAAALGDGVQQCLAWEDQPLTTVLRDLLTESGIDFERVDVPGFAAEEADWLGQKFHVTACLADGEDVSVYLGELAQQSSAVIWWAPTKQKIKYKVIGPRPPSETVGNALTDEAHLIDDSVQVTTLDDKRFTFAGIYYDIEKATANRKEAKSYLRGEIYVDADAESPEEYGDRRQKIEYSRWFTADNQQAMSAIAGKRISYYRDAPQQIEFAVDPKDASIAVGDLYDLSTRGIVDFDGTSDTVRVLITKRADDNGKGRINCTARTTVFGRRYAFIAPAGHPNYTAATEAERAYAFICGSDGKMSNGDDGYIVT